MREKMFVEYMNAIRARYLKLGYTPYRWFHAEGPPTFTPLKKELRNSTIGLLSTSGAYSLGQRAYHYKDDTSLRAIDKNTIQEDIRFSHITENYLSSPRKDPDCILPIGQLRHLEDKNIIGKLADRVYSCMGGVYSQRRVLSEIAPEIYKQFRSQEVDVAMLIPM